MIIPFHIRGDEDGAADFYAVAWCPVTYQAGNPFPAEVGLYFSPSPEFSRFSFHAYGHDGQSLSYQRGPDYSKTAEAALLLAWYGEGVPPFCWRLARLDGRDNFLSRAHGDGYWAARREVCLALYGPRLRAWATQQFGAEPLFGPPPDGYLPVDAFAAGADNEELHQAAVDDDEQDGRS